MLGNNTETRTLEILWSNDRLGFTNFMFSTKLLHINLYSRLILAKKSAQKHKKSQFFALSKYIFSSPRGVNRAICTI